VLRTGDTSQTDEPELASYVRIGERDLKVSGLD
jgi:hypothetical protein